MGIFDVERFFFDADATAEDSGARDQRGHRQFRPPPLSLGRTPYRLGLDEILPARTGAITQAGTLIFHTVGDTGGVNGTGAQQNVADHMAAQIRGAPLAEQPSFFLHLGDVVYYNGEGEDYHDQFYFPYQDYPAPILAIPGNHDGSTLKPADTLVPFYEHFCAPEPNHAPEAGHSNRPRMTLPNCFWRLDAPFLTIVGLYSNVSGELDNPDDDSTPQADWLTEQLADAPADVCLLLAVHHPLYSLGKHGGTEPVRMAIEQAMRQSGRAPDAILTGHDHCYQRFTLKREKREIPVLVVGAGGYATYDDLTKIDEDGSLPERVKLEAYEDKRPGFMRMTVSGKTLHGEYFTVPKAGHEEKPEKLRDEFTVDLKTHRLVR